MSVEKSLDRVRLFGMHSIRFGGGAALRRPSLIETVDDLAQGRDDLFLHAERLHLYFAGMD